ncbi:unnamed protein product [Lactuca saligna]|uniref:DUF4283 domain-containing protein n=1 Tax=Lactuca saligna TaxID=75948 RepID=A0AA36EFF8_LACSI|nr:unnamed protein product [Lactuca saligna]
MFGKRFAFVRFFKVQDEKQLELKLRDLWIGSYHVFVSLAKFGRENNHVHGESQVHVHTVGGGSNTTQKVTYANVVKGGIVKLNKAEKLIILDAEEAGEMTPKGKLKSIDMENDNSIGIEQEYGNIKGASFVDRKGRFFQTDPLKFDAHRRSSNSVPIDASVGGPIDANDDQIGDVGSGTVSDVPVATLVGPTVEDMQGLGDDNVSNDPLSQPPGFKRDVELNPGTSKMKSNFASSHGSSRLLK